jgi:hypothetical protein
VGTARLSLWALAHCDVVLAGQGVSRSPHEPDVNEERREPGGDRLNRKGPEKSSVCAEFVASRRVVRLKPTPERKDLVKLERALLRTFREIYNDVPRCNSHGKKMKELDEYRYFE